MQLLVVDTNVIIDLEVGGICKELFLLSYQIAVPDVLFEQELKEHHANLKELGLKTLALESSTMELVVGFHKYKEISLMDRFVLALALQEEAILITGDRKLRAAAEKENAVLKGTIGLVERMITEGKISVGQASQAQKRMEQGNRWLPQNEFTEMLDRHRV